MKRSHPPSPPRRKQVNSNSLSSSPAQMEDRGLTAGEALSRQPWLPVCIGKDQLLAKAWFGDLAYHILLTDTRAVWAESMDSAAIQRRAQELNKRLRAPVEAFYSHLRDVALPCLSGPLGEGEVPAGGGAPEEGGATVTLTRPGSGTVAGGGVCVRLKSELAGLPFHWEFRLASPPADTVCSELVRPLLVMSRLLQTQVDQLGALLARKDAQIQDYRETGATLSRARLQTEVFDEQAYKDNIIAQLLPQVMSEQGKGFVFDSDLRELYSAVVAHGNPGKRKRPSSPSSPLATEGREVELAPSQTPTPGGADARGEAPPTRSVQVEPGANQESPRSKMAERQAEGVRTQTRPKKKKAVGLFR
ncbi:non-homologous end-joining factor 1 isoform X1 [Gadus morhua]|nr:non-homologous end-joining factor 1 isoform X1 [Gadus morhua]